MDDLFLPGWQVPPGTWPYSIQDLLRAVFPPAAPPSDAGTRSPASSAGPPSGGLLGVLAKPNADWNRGFAASDPPADGGLFSSLDRSDIGRSPSSPYWLQTAVPSSFGGGQPLPWSDPRPQAMSSSTSPPLGTPDPNVPYWLQTVLPFQANGSGLPFFTPSDNEPTYLQPQQSQATTQESSALPIPPMLAPTFPPVPPSLNWNNGTRSLPQIPIRLGVEHPGPDGPTQFDSDPGNISEPWPNISELGYANRPPDEAPATWPPPYSAVAANPTERARSPQPWPTSSSDYLGIGSPSTESRGATRNPPVLSDALPDIAWKPGARYATEERRSVGGVPVRIEAREFEIEAGLAGQLVEAQTRAEHATAQVRKLDPNWRPRPSFFEDVQGAIRAYRSEAEQAQARLRELAALRIPMERPPTTRERNDVARDLARSFARNYRHAIEGAAWLSELEPSIEAYLDPPKTLEELQRAVSNPRPGSDIHHVVEKSSAEEDGFPKSMIHGSENLVRIPRFKHWEINSWYMTRNEDYEGLSPRDYLRGKSWDVRLSVGLKALIKHGVLKP